MDEISARDCREYVLLARPVYIFEIVSPTAIVILRNILINRINYIVIFVVTLYDNFDHFIKFHEDLVNNFE